jgi:sarcosine oxidase subunit beta
MTESRSAEAIVIGAGVIGSAVALELARAGRTVIVVDRLAGPGSGSTSASSSIIRYSYSTRDAILTSWEAAQMWFDWEGHLGCVDPDGMARFIECANLIFQTTGYDGAPILPWWDEFGIEYEVLDSAQLRARFPLLDPGKFYPPKRIDDPAFADDAVEELTAIYNKRCGFMDDPMLSAKNLAYAARQHGAEFLFRSEVASIDRTADGSAVAGVTLESGEVISAPVVVNVAGPHSTIVNRLAGVTDDMAIHPRPLRAEVFTAQVPTGLRLEDGMPFVSDLDVGLYYRPQPGGTMLIGGTEPDCDELHWVDDPDSNSEFPTVEVWETYMMRFARRVPEFGVPSQPVGLSALYDTTDDWVPIYDRSSLHGYFMACGTSGNQFKNAPIAGQFMRDIIDATMSGHDHDADPLQFRGPFTGELIDLAAFSRNRPPAQTSNTVMG